MQTLATGLIPFGQHIDRFDTRLVVDSRVIKVDDNIFRIVIDLKQLFERRSRSKEQRSVQLIDLAAKFVVLHIGSKMSRVIPSEHQ